MISKNVEECWQVAFDEAERYQEEANKLKNDTVKDSYPILSRNWDESIKKVKELIAKRDAASRIARLIKYGYDNTTIKIEREK